MARYVGDTWTITATVTDPSGALTDATSVAATIQLPDGSTDGPHAMAHASTGTYTYPYVSIQAGPHLATFAVTGGGSGVGAGLVEFYAEPLVAGIVSLADVRAHLGIAQTATDDRLRSHLLLASEMVERHVNRLYRRQTITELHDGGTDTIILRKSPAQSITSVTIGGSVLAATDYTLDATANLLVRNVGTGTAYWVGGQQNVQVVYVAGASTVPWYIRQGVLELVRHLWDSQRGGYSIPKQQGAGDDRDPRQAYSMPRRVAELIEGPDMGPGF